MTLLQVRLARVPVLVCNTGVACARTAALETSCSQVVGEPKREEGAHNRATEFSGYVKRVPQARSNEKMVGSLLSSYNVTHGTLMTLNNRQQCAGGQNLT